MWISFNKIILAIITVTVCMDILLGAAGNNSTLVMLQASNTAGGISLNSKINTQYISTSVQQKTENIKMNVSSIQTNGSTRNPVFSTAIMSKSTILQTASNISTVLDRIINTIQPSNSFAQNNTSTLLQSTILPTNFSLFVSSIVNTNTVQKHSVTSQLNNIQTDTSSIIAMSTSVRVTLKIIPSSISAAVAVNTSVFLASITNVTNFKVTLLTTLVSANDVILSSESMKPIDALSTKSLDRTPSFSFSAQDSLFRSTVEKISPSKIFISDYIASSSVLVVVPPCVSPNCPDGNTTSEESKEFMLMVVGVSAGAVFLFFLIFVACCVYIKLRRRSLNRTEARKPSYHAGWSSPPEKASDGLLGSSESVELFTSSSLQVTQRGINNYALEQEDSMTTLPSTSRLTRQIGSTFNPKQSDDEKYKSASFHINMEDVDVIPTGFQQTILTGVGKEKTEEVNLKLQTDWTDALADSNSEEYKDLKEDVEDSMQTIYVNDAGFRGSRVKNFRKGSVIADIELIFLLDYSNPLGPLQLAVSHGKVGHMKVDQHFPLIQEEQPDASDVLDGGKPMAEGPNSVAEGPSCVAAKQNGEKKQSDVKIKIPISKETSTDHDIPDEDTTFDYDNYPEVHVNIAIDKDGGMEAASILAKNNAPTEQTFEQLESERCESEPSSSPPAYSNLTSLSSISEMNITYNPDLTENDLQLNTSMSGSRDSGIGSMQEITRTESERDETFYDIPEASEENTKSQQNGSASGIAHIAVFNFIAKDWRELSIQQGEGVDVIKDDDATGWVKARNRNGKEGWIPSTFLVEVDPTHLASTKEAVQTLEFFDNILDEYESEGSASSDVTSPGSPVNEYLTPVNEYLTPVNEYLIPVNEYLIPVNEYLDPVNEKGQMTENVAYTSPEETRKELGSQLDERIKKDNHFEASFGFDGQGQDELTFQEGDIIEIVKSSNTGWWKGRSQGREGWFPASYVKPLERNKVEGSDTTVSTDKNNQRTFSVPEKQNATDDLFAPPESYKTLYVQILRTKSSSELSKRSEKPTETQPEEYAEIAEIPEECSTDKSKQKVVIPQHHYEEPPQRRYEERMKSLPPRDYEQPTKDPSRPERSVPFPPKDLSASSSTSAPFKPPPEVSAPSPSLIRHKEDRKKPILTHGLPPKRPVPPPPNTKPALITEHKLTTVKEQAPDTTKATNENRDNNKTDKTKFRTPVGITLDSDFKISGELEVDNTVSVKHVQLPRKPLPVLNEETNRNNILSDGQRNASVRATNEHHSSPPKKLLPSSSDENSHQTDLSPSKFDAVGSKVDNTVSVKKVQLPKKPLPVLNEEANRNNILSDGQKNASVRATNEQHSSPSKKILPSSSDEKSHQTALSPSKSYAVGPVDIKNIPSSPPNRPILPAKPASHKQGDPLSLKESKKPLTAKPQPYKTGAEFQPTDCKPPMVAHKPTGVKKQTCQLQEQSSSHSVSSTNSMAPTQSKSPPPDRPPAPRFKDSKSNSSPLDVSDSDETHSPKIDLSRSKKPIKPNKALTNVNSIKSMDSTNMYSGDETRSFSLKELVDRKKMTQSIQSKQADHADESVLSSSESSSDLPSYINISKTGGPVPLKRPYVHVVSKNNKDVLNNENTLKSASKSPKQGIKHPPPKPTSPPVVNAEKEGVSRVIKPVSPLKGSSIPVVPKNKKDVLNNENTLKSTPESPKQNIKHPPPKPTSPPVVNAKKEGESRAIRPVSPLKGPSVPVVTKNKKDILNNEITLKSTPESPKQSIKHPPPLPTSPPVVDAKREGESRVIKPVCPPKSHITSDGMQSVIPSTIANDKCPRPAPKRNYTDMELVQKQDIAAATKHPNATQKSNKNDTDKKPIPAPRRKITCENLDEIESTTTKPSGTVAGIDSRNRGETFKERPVRPPPPSIKH